MQIPPVVTLGGVLAIALVLFAMLLGRGKQPSSGPQTQPPTVANDASSASETQAALPELRPAAETDHTASTEGPPIAATATAPMRENLSVAIRPVAELEGTITQPETRAHDDHHRPGLY